MKRSQQRSDPESKPKPAEDADPLASFGLNAGFVEELRGQYQVDPESLGKEWSAVFRGAGSVPARSATASAPVAGAPAAGQELSPEAAQKHARVLRLIHMYRARGHRIADIDPLGGRE